MICFTWTERIVQPRLRSSQPAERWLCRSVPSAAAYLALWSRPATSGRHGVSRVRTPVDWARGLRKAIFKALEYGWHRTVARSRGSTALSVDPLKSKNLAVLLFALLAQCIADTSEYPTNLKAIDVFPRVDVHATPRPQNVLLYPIMGEKSKTSGERG